MKIKNTQTKSSFWSPNRWVAPIAFAAAAFAGCSEFAETSEMDNGRTLTVVDNRLPDSLDTAFEACVGQIDINSGESEVEITDGCDTDQLDSIQDLIAAAALAAQDTIELDEAIPIVLDESSETYSGFPWPVQNCEVQLDYAFEFDGLSLDDLDARWRSNGGDPQLRVDLDFPRSKIGEIDIDVDVDCPSNVSEGIVNFFTSTLRNELQGRHDVFANGMDLDLYFDIDHNGRQLLVDLQTEFDASSITVDLDWSKVETIRVLGFNIDVVDRNDILGPAETLLIEEGNAVFADALAGLADSVEDGLNQLVPEGHQICELRGTNSSMEMETIEGSNSWACARVKANPIQRGSLSSRRYLGNRFNRGN